MLYQHISRISVPQVSGKAFLSANDTHRAAHNTEAKSDFNIIISATSTLFESLRTTATYYHPKPSCALDLLPPHASLHIHPP